MRTLLIGVLFSVLLISPVHAETAYERVLKTNTLRCGYILWPMSIEKDPNSAAFTGMNYDFVNKLGERLGLKIEWATELASGTQIESLKTGKIDAVCASEGPLVLSTGRYLAYTTPIMYSPFFIYVRAGDGRFDNSRDRLNQSDVTFSVIDGDNTQFAATSQFPNAKQQALPNTASAAELLKNVVDGKADAVVMDPGTVQDFMVNNAGTLKRAPGIGTINYIPNTLSVLNTETQLLNFLNVGIQGMHAYGDAEPIFKKYEARYAGSPVVFFRPALPFKQ